MPDAKLKAMHRSRRRPEHLIVGFFPTSGQGCLVLLARVAWFVREVGTGLHFPEKACRS